ncbi:hypothetical protein LZ32DRAFT_341155 [Colletotrichum eremochloae]|nr:hypothetical protein LZ32DRAFT_341155 [Colletotrichum eremochloae]
MTLTDVSQYLQELVEQKKKETQPSAFLTTASFIATMARRWVPDSAFLPDIMPWIVCCSAVFFFSTHTTLLSRWPRTDENHTYCHQAFGLDAKEERGIAMSKALFLSNQHEHQINMCTVARHSFMVQDLLPQRLCSPVSFPLLHTPCTPCPSSSICDVSPLPQSHLAVCSLSSSSGPRPFPFPFHSLP